jgi:hypothetical protein
MIDTIIGGAIAAVMGGVAYGGVALWQERHRENARRLAIVEALAQEMAENMVIYESVSSGDLWWLASFVLDAYDTYKGQEYFLPDNVTMTLGAAVGTMRGLNAVIEDYRSRHGLGKTPTKNPIPVTKNLFGQLELMYFELNMWREKHTRSIFSVLVSGIHHRLRTLVSKIRDNSKSAPS